MVYESFVKAFGQRGYGHLEDLDAVGGLEGRCHAPAQDTLAVGVHDDGQEAESVAQASRGVFYRDVGYVTDPYLVGPCGNYALDEVRVGRQVVARVRCAGRTPDILDVQSTLMHDAAEGVASNAVLLAEAALVHPPQFIHAHHRILLPYFKNILDNKLFQCQSAEQQVVVLLVKGLSCHTSQCTKLTHSVS